MSPLQRYSKLFEPGQLGPVRTKNRIVKPAQGMRYATDDGFVGDRTLGYYEAIAKGGVGLIITEVVAVDFPAGHVPPNDLMANDDRFIPGLAELARTIHRHDVRAFMQVQHFGPSQDLIPGHPPRSSSSLEPGQQPRATFGPTIGLTVAEIASIVSKFADAAERAKKAGFDGVEIHGGHGYLVNSFLSRAWNRRDDAYGGSAENRARFACEVIDAVRARVGPDFAVGIRMNGAEYGTEQGLTPRESQAIAQMLAARGVDYISVSSYGYGRHYNMMVFPEQTFYPEAPRNLPAELDATRNGPGALTLLAAGIRGLVSVPIITVGGMEPRLAERMLQLGRADFVAFGRSLMADPDMFRKVLEGREEDIAPCTRCNVCIDTYYKVKPVACRINATLGREREYVVSPAARRKKVMVVGGGPGGMEAARVAAARGHEVVLYDKSHRLGGSMTIQALVKGVEIEDLVRLTRYFRTQLHKLGVELRLGRAVTEAVVREVAPDVVILATGGMAPVPSIKGIESSSVLTQAQLQRMVQPYLRVFGARLLRSLTRLYLPVGANVVIIGGAMQGVQLAAFLIKRGRKVTVVESSPTLGAGLVEYTRLRLLPWLEENGCRLVAGVTYDEITHEGLSLFDKDGTKHFYAADTILTAAPLVADTSLFDRLKDTVPELFLIGDAREPQLVREAVADGFRTALAL